jgi:eukaryotic-like serine/threonine-protein kinase
MDRMPRPDSSTTRTMICQIGGMPTFSSAIKMPTARARTVDWTTAPESDWRYEILNPIGKGGMATVYLARDLLLGRKLAMKLLSTNALIRFRREARLHSVLEHTAIAPLYDAGRLADGRYFLAMKYVAGHTLAELAEEPPADPAELSTRLSWFEQVGHAIAYAHAKRIIHRDLKPENVMVSGYGRVYLIDWGLAKQHEDAPPEDDTATGENTALGTLAYMAPEQAGGGYAKATEASDVFGLGAMLCTVLTGQPPYVGSPADVYRMVRECDTSGAVCRLSAAGTPYPLMELVRQCLAPNPQDRPASARQVVSTVIQWRQTDRVERPW